MKVCSKCAVDKPLSGYHKRQASPDGLQARCKSCINETQRQRVVVNGIPKAQYNQEFHYRTKRSITRHGLTGAQFDSMVESQGGNCAVCGNVLRTPCVDHDKSCCPGQWSCGSCIRGVVCKKHNTALGGFNDNPALLRRAADYLESFSPSGSEPIVSQGI